MTDRIIYKLISTGGGIDGRDFEDKGGVCVFASFDKKEAESSPKKPWAQIVTDVVDVEKARRAALAKLDPVDRLVLGL